MHIALEITYPNWQHILVLMKQLISVVQLPSQLRVVHFIASHSMCPCVQTSSDAEVIRKCFRWENIAHEIGSDTRLADRIKMGCQTSIKVVGTKCVERNHN